MQTAAARALAWRQKLPLERRRRSMLRGGGCFLRSAAVYLVLFTAACWGPAWMRVGALLVLPFAIGALFVIGHDAAHHSLVPSPRVNAALGRLAFLPALHPYTSWVHAHNTLHHGGTCLKGRHPDFAPMSKHEFDGLPHWRQWLERVYRAPLGVGICYATDFYRRFILHPRAAARPRQAMAFQLDRLLVAAFLVGQFVAASALVTRLSTPWFHPLIDAAVIVIVPWSLWIYFMGIASFVQHTHPRTAWYDNAQEWQFHHVQLRSSTHMVLPRPLGAVLHNIMDHPAHHLDPTIPLYELPPSQSLLERETPQDSVVVPLTWDEYRRICRTCKLYDYQRHRWLDFDGRPTTPAGLNEAPVDV